jgi:hypothetical protein
MRESVIMECVHCKNDFETLLTIDSGDTDEKFCSEDCHLNYSYICRMENMELEAKNRDYQFGLLIGELVWRNMSTLSSDGFGENKKMLVVRPYSVKDMDKEDSDRYTKIDDEWYKSYQGDKEGPKTKQLWAESRSIYRELSRKYLKSPFVYRNESLNLSNIEDMYLFKRGIISYLWNTDECHYSLKEENIKITPGEWSTEYEFIIDDTE